MGSKGGSGKKHMYHFDILDTQFGIGYGLLTRSQDSTRGRDGERESDLSDGVIGRSDCQRHGVREREREKVRKKRMSAQWVGERQTRLRLREKRSVRKLAMVNKSGGKLMWMSPKNPTPESFIFLWGREAFRHVFPCTKPAWHLTDKVLSQ